MKFLEIDDVFLLEDGMKVYAQIPEKYVYSNRPFSKDFKEHDIEVGLLYTNEEVTKRSIRDEVNHIANEIWRLFLDVGYEIEFTDCNEFVNSHIDINTIIALSTFKFKGGLFKVVYTAMEGGSSGHDPFPDGWHVKAVRLIDGKLSDKKEDKIHFFQSGCFTAMIEKVKIVKI